MELIAERPEISVYGYSKSWELFLNYKKAFPVNYTLNISSGSKYSKDIEAKVEKLSCTRGQFVAVPMPKGIKADYSVEKKSEKWKAYAKAVKESAASKYGNVFVCPGRCGSCTLSGHACGSDRFNDITIAIGEH